MPDTTLPTPPTAGIFAGVPDESYHSHAASVSKSTLKYLDRYQDYTPAHCLHYMRHGLKETEAIIAGRAMELAACDPDAYRSLVIPKRSFGGTGAKKAREEWKAENADKLILPPDVYERGLAFIDLFAERPKLRAALDRREQQISMLWQDEQTGVWLRCRPDMCDTASYWDVKYSSTGIGRRDIQDHLRKYGAALQAAMFRNGHHAITGESGAPACYLLMLSGSGPVDAVILRLDREGSDEWIVYGETVLREVLPIYARCMREGSWPGRIDGKIETPAMDEWLYNQTEARALELAQSAQQGAA